MKKLVHMAAAFWGAALLSACGTIKVESVRVPPGELSGYMATPGIYYALPRSEIALQFPVTLERQVKGFKGNIIDDCIAACTEARQADIAKPKACEIPKANDSIVLGRPEIVRRDLQDLNHLYRLTVDGGFLTGVTHGVTVSENGVLSESSSKVSNQTADLVLGLVSQAMKWKAMTSGSKSLPGIGTTALTCQEARDIAAAEAGFKKQIDELEKVRTAILVPRPGVMPVLDADQSRLAADRLREQVAAVEQVRANYRTKQDLTEVKKTIKTKLFSQGLAPAENQALAPVQLVFRDIVESESSEVLAMKIHEVLNTALILRAGIKPQVPVAGWNAGAAEPLVAGYRYRIPMAGLLEVTCEATADAVSVCTTGSPRTIFEQEVAIAQYGALASLPVEFKGKEATVKLSLHSSTGGISAVNLGVEPIGAKPFLDTIDSLRTSREAKKTREDAEEKAVAQTMADAEVNLLTREKDLLKLKKEIRDLQKDLGQ